MRKSLELNLLKSGHTQSNSLVKNSLCANTLPLENPTWGYVYIKRQLRMSFSCSVDATKETGRLGRLLNHSKTSSNVCTKLYPINDTPHLILVASRTIGLDEELLYDYGDRSRSSIESYPWLKT